jgi:hypothetical protein
MNSRSQLFFAVILIVAAGISRLIPHPMNFAPITAIALFGGMYFDRRFAPILPLAALLISDYFLGMYEGIMWVYGSFLLVVAIGMMARSHKSVPVIAGSTLTGSLLFFIITNFGVWQSGVLYPLTWDGFVACYVAALPFFRNAVLGDIFYVTVLFGAFEFGLKYVPQLRTTKV